MSILIESGATHNFIDAHLVQRRGIPTDTFDGFSILVPGDRPMQCMKYVPSLSVTMGSYTLVDHFFVVDIRENFKNPPKFIYIINEIGRAHV